MGAAPDWNVYAIVVIIELARTESQNPELPEWLREDYFRSIQELAQMGTKEILPAEARKPKEPSSALLPSCRTFDSGKRGFLPFPSILPYEGMLSSPIHFKAEGRS